MIQEMADLPIIPIVGGILSFFITTSVIAAQVVVSSIIWEFCRLKKPRCQEMSTHTAHFIAYAPILPFSYFSVIITVSPVSA